MKELPALSDRHLLLLSVIAESDVALLFDLEVQELAEHVRPQLRQLSEVALV
jgi:hypothetical protein